jgi:Skp family chaperone for outer membrane proteins
MKIQVLIAALALGIGAPVFAQTPATPNAATPKLDQRQINQQKRIDQGVASGSLTSKEAANLDKRQDKIEADEAAAKADGKVTRAERRKLQREESRASAAIKRQKHDGQKVAPGAAK